MQEVADRLVKNLVWLAAQRVPPAKVAEITEDVVTILRSKVSVEIDTTKSPGLVFIDRLIAPWRYFDGDMTININIDGHPQVSAKLKHLRDLLV